MAIAGLGVARELGVGVPEELSIVGFDDIPLAKHVHPSLTTIRPDLASTGAVAARLLLARLRAEASGAAELPAPQLILRDSTGRAP